MNYRIIVADSDKNLVGYKIDSFWSLDRYSAKDFNSELEIKEVEIPDHMIANLRSLLMLEKDTFFYTIYKKAVAAYWSSHNSYLIGLENSETGETKFTHCVTKEEDSYKLVSL